MDTLSHNIAIPTTILIALLMLAGIGLAILSRYVPDTSTKQGQTVSETEKLSVLASLAATSSGSVDEKEQTLHAIPQASSSVTEEEKLKLLQQLHSQ